MQPGGTGDGMAHGATTGTLEFGAGSLIWKQGRAPAQVAIGGNGHRSGKPWRWTVGQGVKEVSDIEGIGTLKVGYPRI
jgi:hypothetical protein